MFKFKTSAVACEKDSKEDFHKLKELFSWQVAKCSHGVEELRGYGLNAVRTQRQKT